MTWKNPETKKVPKGQMGRGLSFYKKKISSDLGL